MILDRLFRSNSLENPSTTISQALRGGMEADSGASVTAETATTISPVWQAITLISGDVSKLPLYVYERIQDDGENEGRRISKHPAAKIIHPRKRANPQISGLKLWRRAMVSALLYGNGYVWIEREFGRPKALYNLLPDRTFPMVGEGGRVTYITETGGRLVGLNVDDVLHIESACWDGLEAPAFIKQARHDLGVQLSARGFTSKFFKNGLQLGGILQVPANVGAAKRKKYEADLALRAQEPTNWFKSLVLRDGFRWHSVQSTMVDAQSVEIDEQQTRHVCRWFNLSPDRLGLKESSSYNSLEQRRRDYVDNTLSYWLSQILAECNTKLLSEEEQEQETHFVDYLIQSLLWADASTVATIATAGVQNGWLLKNEVRAWLNLNPLPKNEESQ